MSNIKRWVIGIVAASLVAFGAGMALQSTAQAQGGLEGIFGDTGTSAPTTCALDNIGWLMCPILRSAAKAGDHAFTFISQNFLGLEIALFNADSGTREAWSTMRDIANVAFALAFLVVIYSLITGRGVGNYNIKRLLPRFIIGAIMVNVSFYICQIMIDISNITGSFINSMFARIAGSIGVSGMPLAEEAGSYDPAVLTTITANVIGNVSVAWVLFAPLLAIVLAIAIICSTIIVVLIVRKTLVVALVLLSPLAFVAYLLPNTEHYFSKWLRLFYQTLLLFPVVAILLGTGQVVSATIIKAGADGYQVEGDRYTPRGELASTSATLRLVAAGAAVLPLAGTWYAFKAAMAGADAAALRVRQGARRSNSQHDESAKRREQTAMDLNKKSMMLKGINRLQQINAVQDGDTSGASLIGRLGGGSYRSRKKQQKSDEQVQFDQQVQGRLNDLRGQSEGLTPQQAYSRALQRYQDAEAASGDGNFNINSYEGIDLKAAEAYLLENIGQGGVSGVGGVAAVVGAAGQQGKGDTGATSRYDKPKQPGATVEDQGAVSHYDKASQASGGGAVSTDNALKTATLGGGAVQAGKVVVQVAAGEAAGAGEAAERRIASVRQQDPVSDIELQAKSRAARYLQDSQDEQGLLRDELLSGGSSSSGSIVASSRRSLEDKAADDTASMKLPRER